MAGGNPTLNLSSSKGACEEGRASDLKEEDLLIKSRKVVALGLTLAVGVAGVAFATAADDNDAQVVGKVAPAKLDKKKFKPVNLTLGVKNSDDWITGAPDQPIPMSEFIEISKNVKVNLNKAPRCKAPIPDGTPTETARKSCPKKSVLGTGKATVVSAGGTVIATPVVTVFNGPGKNQVRLHTYAQALASSSPVVQGRIVKAKTKGYGQALSVPNAPDTGGLLITLFQAKLKKGSKVVTARCKPKQIKFKRTVVYKDESSESVTKKQKCTVKKAKKKKK